MKFLLLTVLLFSEIGKAELYEEDFSDGFFCEMSASFFQQEFFRDRLGAEEFCFGFGDIFSRSCQFQRLNDGRWLAKFQHQRSFQHKGFTSFERSRSRVFIQYFEFFNFHKFFQRRFKHSWQFTRGCH
ncbi:hypothetical protein CMK18_22645 [Candidatus Poribacteria bacterium]|nr:hypothetical protein [Candidatus Poribacteria bacterium]|tara:strand:- start:1175 stop:1558 length:384 start_codon:yes stop_codon:yes gene_type:complete